MKRTTDKSFFWINNTGSGLALSGDNPIFNDKPVKILAIEEINGVTYYELEYISVEDAEIGLILETVSSPFADLEEAVRGKRKEKQDAYNNELIDRLKKHEERKDLFSGIGLYGKDETVTNVKVNEEEQLKMRSGEEIESMINRLREDLWVVSPINSIATKNISSKIKALLWVLNGVPEEYMTSDIEDMLKDKEEEERNYIINTVNKTTSIEKELKDKEVIDWKFKLYENVHRIETDELEGIVTARRIYNDELGIRYEYLVSTGFEQEYWVEERLLK